MSKPDFVGLAEVVRQVRSELEKAREEGDTHPLGFTVERVSLEFTVQVHRTGNGKGGLRIGVVTAELGASLDRGTTHRVQVDLQPQWEDGRNQIGRAPSTPAR